MTPDEKLDKAMELLDKAIDILDKAYEMHKENTNSPHIPFPTISPGIPNPNYFVGRTKWPEDFPDISLQNCNDKVDWNNFGSKHKVTGKDC